VTRNTLSAHIAMANWRLLNIVKFRPLLCWFKPQIYLLSADIVLPAGFFVHRTARDASVGVSEVLGGRKI
jgi:hypothetical protein